MNMWLTSQRFSIQLPQFPLKLWMIMAPSIKPAIVHDNPLNQLHALPAEPARSTPPRSHPISSKRVPRHSPPVAHPRRHSSESIAVVLKVGRNTGGEMVEKWKEKIALQKRSTAKVEFAFGLLQSLAVACIHSWVPPSCEGAVIGLVKPPAAGRSRHHPHQPRQPINGRKGPANPQQKNKNKPGSTYPT